ncbi:hypothetical protein NBRC116584_36180 [Hydrogenophaga sp. 5NK40-0174]
MLEDLLTHKGARFVELLHRVGAPRDSLVRTLQALGEAGWVARNPGHGHPLRPEYVLTSEGAAIAASAAPLHAAQQKLGLAPGSLSSWGMPLVSTIGSGACRFSEISHVLSSATPRAISQGLQTLAANDLVFREEIEGRGKNPGIYGLTTDGLYLAKAI